MPDRTYMFAVDTLENQGRNNLLNSCVRWPWFLALGKWMLKIHVGQGAGDMERLNAELVA